MRCCKDKMSKMGFLEILMFLLFAISTSNVNASIQDKDRFQCYPEDSVTEVKCIARGCIWKAKPAGAKKEMPECFYNSSMNYGYTKRSGQVRIKNGYLVFLKRGSVLPENETFIKPIKNASVTVQQQTKSRLRITIRDAMKQRFEVPVQKNFPKPADNVQSPLYSVTESNSIGYNFVVRRNDGKSYVSIFDTGVGALVMSDQFLQISARLDSSYCYGLGEHEHKSFKLNFNWTKHVMFSRDQPPAENANLYGVHPFYMCLEKDGKAHGVLLLNSNAMEITLQPTPAITFRTIGGVLDFYFFLGPTPADVVNQYTELIGRPFMPPYWSLGFQLCRYGYNSLAKVKATVKRMSDYDIPQDVQYGDIDYMNRQLDFTINPKTYTGLEDYVRELKKNGIRYISILDPAISANETTGTYEPYDLGQKMDIWIKDHEGKPLYGKVWPDYPNVTVDEKKDWDYQTKNYRAYAVFPDFTHPKISDYWGKLVVDFHKRIAYDGIWIDMNEPASFVHGSVKGCPDNTLEKPPYKPGVWGPVLADKTVCMSAKHHDGKVEYDMHSLFGWSQTEPTYNAVVKSTGKRPVVISRSTYPSSGKHAGHWLGDNTSAWPQMKYSIIGMLEFGLFGIPYIGADICGFFKDTTPELCDRWMALGAFYPFSRNHNGKGFMEQDPAFFGKAFAKRSREVLRIRYALLPYLYTLFYEAHMTGAPIVRPLMYEFTNDNNTWTIDEQFMWGNALLVTPILRKNQNTSINAYFPATEWFDFHTRDRLPLPENYKRSMENKYGGNLSLPVTSKTLIHLHVRCGTIIPTQDPAKNTMLSRRNPMGLIVAYCSGLQAGEAKGSLFWDDGDSIDSISKSKYQHLEFTAKNCDLKIKVVKNGYNMASTLRIEHLTLVGLPLGCGSPPKVSHNGKRLKNVQSQVDSRSNHQSFRITGLKLALNKDHVIRFASGNMLNLNFIVVLSCIIFSKLF